MEDDHKGRRGMTEQELIDLQWYLRSIMEADLLDLEDEKGGTAPYTDSPR